MFDFNITLENNHILLRPIMNEDLIEFEKITTDPKMWIYTPQDLSIKSGLQKWMAIALDQLNNKVRLPFTIIDKEKNEIIGSSSFGNIYEYDKRIEIGWTWISKMCQGKGINNQAKYMMIQYCFEELSFERVEFKTDVLNTYARKALARVGAKEEGILRNHSVMTNNRRRDTIYYSILKSEWSNIKTDYLFP